MDYVSTEEEKVEINQISIEEKSCGHIVVEDQVCEDESNYCNPYDTHQFPYLHYKECLTISSEPMRKYQTQSKLYSQVTRAVKKQDKQSPFDFYEIPWAPHPMPNDYIRRLPQFSGNNDISIESQLDTLWNYMEIRGVNNEDVYMQALGESLQEDVQLWFDHSAPGSVTGYDMFTDLLIDIWSRNTDDSLDCESRNDYNQYIGNMLSQLDHSSLDMFQIMSMPTIHKNVT